MQLDSTILANNIIADLQTSGFDFPNLPPMIQYEMVEKVGPNGEKIKIAKIENGAAKVIRNFQRPSLEIIIDAIANETIEHIQTSATLDDLSDVTISDLHENDMIIWNGDDWVNVPVRAIDLSTASNSINSSTGISTLTNNYIPKKGVNGLIDSSLNDNGSRVLATKEVQFKNGPWIDVKAYGAKGNGITDNTTAIQAADAAAVTAGVPIHIPDGDFLCLTDPVILSPMTPTSTGVLKWSGFNLTYSGSIPLDITWQIFDCALADVPQTLSEVRPEQFGVDGTADEVEINKAFASLKIVTDSVLATTYYGFNYQSGTVHLQKKTYFCADRVQFGGGYDYVGAILEANGAVIDSTSTTDGFRFGDPTTPSANCKRMINCRVSDLTIASQTAMTGFRRVGRFANCRYENISCMTENSVRGDCKQGFCSTAIIDGNYYDNLSKIYSYYWDVGFAVGADFASVVFRPVTNVDTGTNVLTYTGTPFVDNDSIWIRCLDGNLPSGFSAVPQRLYVVNASGNTCKLSLTVGGGAIAVVTAGDGTIEIGNWPGADDINLFTQNATALREYIAVGPRTFGMFVGGAVQSSFLQMWFFGGSATYRTLFTATDLLNGEMTAAAVHNLTLGDRVIVGKEHFIPKPLSFQSTYYAIPTTTTKFKLATTYANAMAGTFIVLTEAESEPSTTYFKRDHYYDADVVCTKGITGNVFESQHESSMKDSYYIEDGAAGKIIASIASGGGPINDKNTAATQMCGISSDEAGALWKGEIADVGIVRASQKAGYSKLQSPYPLRRQIATWSDDGFQHTAPVWETPIVIPAWGQFAFTADATTDILTVAANTLQTGDKVRGRTTTTLPAGMTTVGRYFYRAITPTTGQLYTSIGAAIAGGASGLVNITDAGTGTHTIEKTAILAYWGNKFICSTANASQWEPEEIVGNPSAYRQRISIVGVGGAGGTPVVGHTTFYYGTNFRTTGFFWYDFTQSIIEFEWSNLHSMWLEVSRMERGHAIGDDYSVATGLKWALAPRALSVGGTTDPGANNAYIKEAITAGTSITATLGNVTATDGDVVITDATNCLKVGTNKVVGARGAALTVQSTTLSAASPGVDDFDIGAGTYGAGTADEWLTLLKVVKNLQIRQAELEARLSSAAGHGLFT